MSLKAPLASQQAGAVVVCISDDSDDGGGGQQEQDDSDDGGGGQQGQGSILDCLDYLGSAASGGSPGTSAQEMARCRRMLAHWERAAAHFGVEPATMQQAMQSAVHCPSKPGADVLVVREGERCKDCKQILVVSERGRRHAERCKDCTRSFDV
jgi:hypothetical protein